MKLNRYSLIVIVIIALTVFLSQIVQAVAYEGKFEYEIKSGTVVITNYIGNSDRLAIPYKIGEVKYAKIVSEAFAGSGLKKIVILNNVKKIEKNAFDRDVTIYGKIDSEAQRYANENNILFKIYCDINGDGKVTATDILKLKKHIAEIDGQMLNEDEQERGDINCDGDITPTDLLIEKKVIVELDETEENDEDVEPEIPYTPLEPEEPDEINVPITDFTQLEWKKDYYWINDDTEPWKIGYSNDETSHQDNSGHVDPSVDQRGVWDGSISRIHFSSKDGDINQVEMIGNSIFEGKGAAWATIEEADVNKISFDYDVDPGDSFDAVGVMFNITETKDTLEGYMLSFNIGYSLLYKALGKPKGAPNNKQYMFTRFEDDLLYGVNQRLGANFKRNDLSGSIIKFKYYKGTINGKIANNKKRIEEVSDILTVFDAGRTSVESSMYPGTEDKPIFKGKCIIEKEKDGIIITVNGRKQIVNITNADLNTFGFYSEHYLHGCQYIGYFNLENIIIEID